MTQENPDPYLWPAFNIEFERELREHMKREEAREKADAVRHALDEKRFDDGAKIMKQLAEDLSPVKKMYYALLGCSGFALALLGMGGWIYTNDRMDAKADRVELKAIAGAVVEQSTAVKVILTRLQDFKEEQDRMRRALDQGKK